jgi:hypothetical protein
LRSGDPSGLPPEACQDLPPESRIAISPAHEQ